MSDLAYCRLNTTLQSNRIHKSRGVLGIDRRYRATVRDLLQENTVIRSYRTDLYKVSLFVAHSLEATGLSKSRVQHKPRLLSENGPCYTSGVTMAGLTSKATEHARGPMTVGKIVRHHR